MSRFDDDRFRASLATIVDQTVLSHYPDAQLMYRLHEYVGDVRSDRSDRSLVDVIVETAQQLDSGELRSPSEFLAALAIRVAHQQHRLYCDHDGRLACHRDLKAVNDLLDALAAWMCNSRLDGRNGAETPILDEAAAECITGAAQDAGASIAELARHLFCRTRPRGDHRELRPITAERPIVQINAAITHMPWGCYEEVKSLTAALNQSLSDTYEVECTNEYANPLQPAVPDELVTRAGVLRSSALVVFSEHGGVGTGRTLEMADLMLIPVLILQRVDANHPPGLLAKRFNGGLSSAPVPYSTDDEAIALVDRFLRINDFEIYQRAQNLAEWDQRGESEIHRVATQLKDVWPSGARLTYEQVVWWLEGVHWPQAPASVRETIIDLLTFVKESAGGPAIDAMNRASPAMRRSRETLRAYRRRTDIRQSRIDALWRAYMHRLSHTPALSSRRDFNTAWEITDWEQLDARLDAS